jgi:DNA-binding transcriptional ArsR family regulator
VITLEIGVADLAASRFAISPLSETVRAIQLLAGPRQASVNAPWLRWAQVELAARPVRLTRTWPLIVTGLDYFPEFLVPAPAVRGPEFAAEADRLRATPAEAVRASLGRVFAGVPWPASAVALAERPEQSLREIADELTVLHGRLIAPHWDRMRAVLDVDIAYRSEVLASGGARALFGGLHEDLRWNAGTLEISDGQERVQRVALGPDGLVLVPGVLTWPRMNTRMATSSQTTVHYPARGAATVWFGGSVASGGSGASGGGETGFGGTVSGGAVSGGAVSGGTVSADPGTGPAAALLGVVRARLLGTLRSPATTTALARAMGVTPGAVSQHLTVLYRGGLIDRSRSGREVLYQTSDLGCALLDQPRRG